MKPVVVCALLLVAGALGSARAQNGVLDQASPIHPMPGANTTYNGSVTSHRWQQQVRVGLSGQLEGFVLQMTGMQGASMDVSLRLGPGWNTAPAAFQAIVLKPTNSNFENVFVDVTSANITVVPGTLFVLDVLGQNTGAGFIGSWIGAPAPPFYSEPMFLNGQCYVDCQYRIGFLTYVVNLSGTTFCFGDGTGTACPCGNAGAADNGCASSVNPSGAHLAVTGQPSIAVDTLVLTGTGMPDSSALYFQGTSQAGGGAGLLFGDGLRCAGGTILRLGAKTNSGGTSAYPSGTDTHISVKGANSPGAVRTYQCWYRNAAPYCSPSTFNVTNGVQVTWGF